MLNIAAANEIETLIVNAYACGRQGFQPAQVIELFQQWIAAHPGAIKTIVFAVPRASFDAFDEAFGQPAPVVEEVVAPCRGTGRRRIRLPRNRFARRHHHSLEAMQLSADQREPRANASQQEKRWMQHTHPALLFSNIYIASSGRLRAAAP